MKINLTKITIGLCLLLTFVTIGATLTFAQNASDSNNQSIKKLVWEMARAKRSNARFTILTPQDLSGLTKEQFGLLMTGDPCESGSTISYGQTVNGQLTSADCQLDDDSYADFYLFSGSQGDPIAINLSSTAFDTYLGLANETGTFVIEDDNGGGGTNARIVATLPASGFYVILANSAVPNAFGNYTLSLTGGSGCTYTVSPQSALIPRTGGNFSFTVNTQANCQWTASTFDSFITTNSGGSGSGVVNYTVAANPSNSDRSGIIRVGNQIFVAHQQAGSCVFTLTPSSVNISPSATTGTFSVTASAGCSWSARSNSSFISATGSGTGNGTVSYSVQNNNGANRVGTVSIGNQTFTVNQAGLNCTYSVTPIHIYAPRSGLNGSITISTQAGCTWFLSRNQTWITIQEGAGSGPATIPLTVAAQPDPQSRSGAIQIFYSLNDASQSMTVFVDQNGVSRNSRFDFTGDGKADLTMFRPSNGGWFVQLSETNYETYYWGLATDILAPADYNGDGKADLAVFRPSNGSWYINTVSDGQISLQFGANGDIPASADYDGDGKDDIAVYRPSTGVWYIRQSSNGNVFIAQFGLTEDVPTLGDFDGDGKADIAVWRPSTGIWYRMNSSNNSFFAQQFGLSEDKPVAADYDGDGKTDIAVWRPSTGVWYRFNSSNNSFVAQQFGLSEDKPVVADYDGDGKSDIALWRSSGSVWYILRSTAGFTARQYGLSDDKPAQNSFIR